MRDWICTARRCAGAMAVLLAVLSPSARAEQRTVNFYNWSNYMAPGVLEDFTKETGIKVVYDTFDANETLETRLLAGKSGYDVVVPTGYFLQRQITAKVFLKLDKSKLPNLVNAWPEVTKRLATYDPGNVYAANYMWGTTGIGYNVKAVQKILGADARIDIPPSARHDSCLAFDLSPARDWTCGSPLSNKKSFQTGSDFPLRKALALEKDNSPMGVRSQLS